jgi:hypothetical protein
MHAEPCENCGDFVCLAVASSGAVFDEPVKLTHSGLAICTSTYARKAARLGFYTLKNTRCVPS